MSNQADNNVDDFGVIAWREDGMWRASRLTGTRDLGLLMDQLKAQQGDCGSIALISIDDEFFLIARSVGRTMQMMLSDVTYAIEYEIAADIIDALDLPFPEEEDDPQPAGDIEILADFGVSAMELEIMSDDLDAYPEDQIAALAGKFVDDLIDVIVGGTLQDLGKGGAVFENRVIGDGIFQAFVDFIQFVLRQIPISRLARKP